MFVIFNKTLFSIILASIVFVSAFDNQQSKDENICGTTRSVLCVSHTIKKIATVAKSIHRIGNEIEKDIIKRIGINDTLHRYLNSEMDYVDSDLPPSQYHEQFRRLNNIDKKDLGDLLLEAHSAMSFYYNSINDLLNMNHVFTIKTDYLFKEIQSYLRDEIICQYRSVLDVYSYEWPSMNQVSRIQFSRRQYENAQSLVHDVHSIVIIRLLNKWMDRIYFVINSFDAKYY